jgi:tRNA(Ile2) C34 agmatinyltransferase TiaS
MYTLGALHAAGVEGVAVNILVAAPLFFGGAILGHGLGERFAVRCLPARCRECGGRTFYRAGRPITYRCPSCGHVHRTRVFQR